MSLTASEISTRKKLIGRLVYNLPVLRARIGASQAKVAEKIGVSRQTYCNFENGKTEMNWTSFIALVAFFYSNEETKEMLIKMEGFYDEITESMKM